MNLVMSNTGAEGQTQRRLGFTAGSRGSLVPRHFRGEELGDEARPRGCAIFFVCLKLGERKRNFSCVM